MHKRKQPPYREENGFTSYVAPMMNHALQKFRATVYPIGQSIAKTVMRVYRTEDEAKKFLDDYFAALAEGRSPTLPTRRERCFEQWSAAMRSAHEVNRNKLAFITFRRRVGKTGVVYERYRAHVRNKPGGRWKEKAFEVEAEAKDFIKACGNALQKQQLNKREQVIREERHVLAQDLPIEDLSGKDRAIREIYEAAGAKTKTMYQFIDLFSHFAVRGPGATISLTGIGADGIAKDRGDV